MTSLVQVPYKSEARCSFIFSSSAAMHSIFAVLLAASAFTAGTALQLPKYVRPCAKSDPNFKDCLTEHATETLASPVLVKGDRKYNIPPLSPLLIKELDVSEGTGLTLKMKDVKVFGLLGASVEKLNIDFDKQRIDGQLRFPVLSIVGECDAAGRILVLPITAHGNINITLVNTTLPADLDYSVRPIGSTKHAVVTDIRATARPTHVHIRFTKLRNDDTLLETSLNEFLNSNSQELFDLMAPSITKSLAKVLGGVFNGIAAVVPFDEVFPETLP